MRKQSIYAVAVASMLAAGAAIGRHSNSERHSTTKTLQLSYTSDSHVAGKGTTIYTTANHGAHRLIFHGKEGSPVPIRATSTWWVRGATGSWVRSSTTITLAGLRVPVLPHPAPAPPAVIKSPQQPAQSQPEVAHPAPPPPPPAQPAPAQPAPAPPAGGVWAELRQCESGGNYAENTGNGYYGAYQFSLSTWYSLGETGLPSNAPPPAQDAAAQRLQAMAGWSQWPVCSQQLGL
jgi:hypothetical protein